MKVQITGKVMVGGKWYKPGLTEVSEQVGRDLIEAGAADPFETKVVKPKETKTAAKKSGITSSSLPDPASPKTTVKKRRGRPPKSL